MSQVEEQKANNETKWRKTVFNTIHELADTVSEERLTASLPHLDCSSWDEVVEERYLGNVCGLPICARPVQHSETHKYHIDRKNNKIYERCKERSKFCCDACFNASVAIRVQLDSQPLWITGENESRMKKTYVVEKPKRMVEEIPAEEKTPVKKSGPRKVPLSPHNVEIVEDRLIAAVNNLKVAERDASTDEEDVDEEEMRQQSVNRYHDSDDETVVERKKQDNEFRESLARFVVTKKSCSATSAPASTGSTASSVAAKSQKNSNKLNLSPSENEKLARIRQKYSRKEQVKAPIMIDAPVLCARKVKETNKAQNVNTNEEIGADGERISIPAPAQKPIVGDPSLLVYPCTSADTDFVLKTVKEWWTERSRHLLLSGGLRPTNDIDRMMRMFLAGEKGGDIDLEDVEVPDQGVENVARRRLQILLSTLKPSWQLMERRLSLHSSQMHSLSSLLGTFQLTAENIVDFDRQHIRLFTAIIFRIVCRFIDDLEESYFPGGYFSKEVCNYLEYCGVEEHTFAFICDEVLRLIA